LRRGKKFFYGLNMKTAISILLFLQLFIQAQAMDLFSILYQHIGSGGPEEPIDDVEPVWGGEGFAMLFHVSEGSYKVDSISLEHFVFNDSPDDLIDPTVEYPYFQVSIYKLEWSPDVFGPVLTSLGRLGNPAFDPTPTQWPGYTAYIKYQALQPLILEPESIYLLAMETPASVTTTFVPTLIFHRLEPTGLCQFSVYDSWHTFTSDGRFGWTSMQGLPKFRMEGEPVDGRIIPCNQPPDISNAHASVARIWPPNGEMVPVTIQGIVDPEGDPLQVTIYSVWQDEPVSTPGDPAPAAPDATGLGTSTVMLRAERLSSGDGRVYTLFYAVTDGRYGHVLSGTVTVGVPHDNGAHAVAIDNHITYDSTVP
jgi:hypothetical protein